MQDQRNQFFGLAARFDSPFNHDIDGHIILHFSIEMSIGILI
jgi:hypothetical protein